MKTKSSLPFQKTLGMSLIDKAHSIVSSLGGQGSSGDPKNKPIRMPQSMPPNSFAPMFYQSAGTPETNMTYSPHPQIEGLQGMSIVKNKNGNTISVNGQTGDSLTNLSDDQAKQVAFNAVGQSVKNFWTKKAAANKLQDTFYITKHLDGSPNSEYEADPNVPALQGFKLIGKGDKYTVLYNDKELEPYKNISIDEVNNMANNLVSQYVTKLANKQQQLASR